MRNEWEAVATELSSLIAIASTTVDPVKATLHSMTLYIITVWASISATPKHSTVLNSMTLYISQCRWYSTVYVARYSTVVYDTGYVAKYSIVYGTVYGIAVYGTVYKVQYKWYSVYGTAWSHPQIVYRSHTGLSSCTQDNTNATNI